MCLSLLVIKRTWVGSIYQQFSVAGKLQATGKKRERQKTFPGVIPSLADFWKIWIIWEKLCFFFPTFSCPIELQCSQAGWGILAKNIPALILRILLQKSQLIWSKFDQRRINIFEHGEYDGIVQIKIRIHNILFLFGLDLVRGQANFAFWGLFPASQGKEKQYLKPRIYRE